MMAPLQTHRPALSQAQSAGGSDYGSLSACEDSQQATGTAGGTFNKAAGQRELVYGAVTTGSEWRFLKLERDNAFIDLDEYFITQLIKILGILWFIIEKNPAG